MIHDSRDLIGLPILAADGCLGKLADIYFEELSWKVGCVVVKTDQWQDGRYLLIAPSDFRPHPFEGETSLRLTRDQIWNDRSLDELVPAGLADRNEHLGQSKLPSHWAAPGISCLSRGPVFAPQPSETAPRGEQRLLGAQSLMGYRLQSEKPALGKLRAVSVDTDTWTIPRFTVETGHWYARKHVSIHSFTVKGIDRAKAVLFVTLSAKQLQRSRKVERRPRPRPKAPSPQ